MSYLALARKWRPGTFSDLVGQAHVVKALVNSLETDRVHHAYLFSGTRGVGKTTIARILAKALNCEQGVSAEPCCKCDTCVAIDEGRFVDLIEVDAASRTGIDDMRELLENVQYAPTNGRYKVYLIDEVHMLSASSFNALLKTLEEPPPHVKFLFATTHPQKLPITVLSRCLQFNLKRLPTTQIAERMTTICDAEGLQAEPAALQRLSRAAGGSMRDGLSLLDQGLVFGGNALNDADAADMLGSLDRKHLAGLLEALASGDAAALVEQIRELDQLVPDYASVLSDLAATLQQIAVVQLAGKDSLDPDAEFDDIEPFCARLSAELVQLFYEIAVIGRRDLYLAPDPRLGFEMCLLRMIAFTPGADAAAGGAPPVPPNSAKGAAKAPAKPAVQAAPQAEPPKTGGAAQVVSETQPSASSDDWPGVVAAMQLSGMAGQLAQNSSLLKRTDTELLLGVEKQNQHLLNDNLKGRLTETLQQHLGASLQVAFELLEGDGGDTVARREQSEQQQTLDAAKVAITTDPNVQGMVELMEATVDDDSIKPVSG